MTFYRFGPLAAALLLAAGLLAPPPGGAKAGEKAGEKAGVGARVVNDQGSVELIAAATAVGDAGQVPLGLHFVLKPGWKIYWRSPGDAGLPPGVDWKGSDNLADTVMSWPVPHRFTVSGLQTLGYKNEVVLPITARLADAAAPLTLRAAVDYLVCDLLCVPQHADLALTLPAGPAVPSPQAHLISRFAAAVPGNGAAKGLSLLSAEATADGRLRVTVAAEPPLQHPDLFVERSDQMQFGPPKLRLSQGGRRAQFELRPDPRTGEGGLTDKPVTLTVADGDRGMEAVTDVAAAQAAPGPAQLLAMLGLALLGGFILNLMPCVLPVLSIKVLSLIGHAGAERRHIRAGFLASAGGIVTSFLALAAVAITVKAAGTAVGWGVQFQQPLFLAVMVVLLTLFAGNLFGFYEVALPHWAGGLGRGYGDPHSLAGHFAAGAFATLLATPCSAPFLGTAVGFALARGPLEILAIFLALGLGMAIPYLAVAAWPALAQRLPRPGRWMLTLRRLLGGILLLTALWLLSVLSVQAGLRAGLVIGGLMASALALLACGRHLPHRPRQVLLALLALGGLIIPFGDLPLAPPLSAHARSAAKGLWQPFDREEVSRAVAAGKTVFIDVTADWCITCQVNKAAVVYRDPVAKRLGAANVVAMQADWTRPDDGIAAYLAGFGRYGIPFNAVYGPGAPDGIPLPELLSEEAVLQALDKAGKAAG